MSTDATIQRDMRLSDLADQVARLLYEVVQIHSHGSIDHLPWSATPTSARNELRDLAESTICELSSTRRELAGIRTRSWMRHWIEAEGVGVVPSCLDQDSQTTIKIAFAALVDALTKSQGPNLLSETLSSWRHELRQP